MTDTAADGVLGLIGRTPIVEIKRLNKNQKVRILAKLEGFNPCSSVKDRIALYMVEGAEQRGELKPGMTILEPTSG
jgi:cysteine synthase